MDPVIGIEPALSASQDASRGRTWRVSSPMGQNTTWVKSNGRTPASQADNAVSISSVVKSEFGLACSVFELALIPDFIKVLMRFGDQTVGTDRPLLVPADPDV
jgi:hypothetical protein